MKKEVNTKKDITARITDVMWAFQNEPKETYHLPEDLESAKHFHITHEFRTIAMLESYHGRFFSGVHHVPDEEWMDVVGLQKQIYLS